MARTKPYPKLKPGEKSQPAVAGKGKPVKVGKKK